MTRLDPTLADAIDDTCLRLDRCLRRAHAIAKVKHIRSLADHNRDCCRAWGVERQALLDARAEAAELGRLLRDLVEIVNASASVSQANHDDHIQDKAGHAET